MENALRDWKNFADQFIALREDNELWRISSKTKQEYLTWSMTNQWVDKTELMLNYARIRNCIYRSTLRRPYSECTQDEIVQDKLKNLHELVKRRPELMEIIQEKL